MGVIELVLAAARGNTGRMAEPAFHEGPVSAGFPLTEVVAWSSAAGLAMLITAIRPSLGTGLATLLAACTSVLAVLLVIGGTTGAATFTLLISYLPIVAGAVLATQVSHRPQTALSRVATAPSLADILLPDKARRGRRRGHLHSADNPAA
ncbi:hypothetical protein [Mycolicibacter minnesotensis]|nr:hypothetical protein [Mycolicibacter minnesotensis]